MKNVLKIILLSSIASFFFIGSGAIHAQTSDEIKLPNGFSEPSVIKEMVLKGNIIRDRRADFAQLPNEYRNINKTIPDLSTLRKQSKYPSLTDNKESVTGPDSGVFYNSHSFKVKSSSILDTDMVVQPDGINWLDGGWLFTTATIRTISDLEVASLYLGVNPDPLFGIYDWSCSVEDPCGNNVGPTYVILTHWSELSCYLRQEQFQNWNYKKAHYVNAVSRLTSNDPVPLWTNQAFLDNFCTGTRDLVYEHTFHSLSIDCSIVNCSFWGPIVEPHCEICAAPQSIKPLGFSNSKLSVNGKPFKILDKSVSTFRKPSSPYEIYYLYNNYLWLIGGPSSDIKNLNSDDTKNYDLQSNVINSIPSIQPDQKNIGFMAWLFNSFSWFWNSFQMFIFGYR